MCRLDSISLPYDVMDGYNVVVQNFPRDLGYYTPGIQAFLGGAVLSVQITGYVCCAQQCSFHCHFIVKLCLGV